jgi:hypothetical protein
MPWASVSAASLKGTVLRVAALLKDFEIRPVVVHPTKRADVSRHGYRAAQFEDAFARFLPPEPNIRTLKIHHLAAYGKAHRKGNDLPSFCSLSDRFVHDRSFRSAGM